MDKRKELQKDKDHPLSKCMQNQTFYKINKSN